jgi:predicted alpha/beta hydrolase family esterase
MKKNVLFIQGGGAGAYEADEKLATSLRDALGMEYDVQYPKMPNEADPAYETYQAQIAKELAALDGPVILVGHSVGGTVLLRFLTEEKVKIPIAGIFLVAPPYWGAEDWLDTHRLHRNLTPQSPTEPPIFFYHSRDDEVVPFAHLAMYAEKLPQATIHEFDGRGHQFHNDLSEVATDIISL